MSTNTNNQTGANPTPNRISDDEKFFKELKNNRIALYISIASLFISSMLTYCANKTAKDQFQLSLNESARARHINDSLSQVAIKDSKDRDSILNKEWDMRLKEFREVQKANTEQQNAFLRTISFYNSSLKEATRSNDLMVKLNSPNIKIEFDHLRFFDNNSYGMSEADRRYKLHGLMKVHNISSLVNIESFAFKYSTIVIYPKKSRSPELVVSKGQLNIGSEILPQGVDSTWITSEPFYTTFNADLIPRTLIPLKPQLYLLIQYESTDNIGFKKEGGIIYSVTKRYDSHMGFDASLRIVHSNFEDKTPFLLIKESMLKSNIFNYKLFKVLNSL